MPPSCYCLPSRTDERLFTCCELCTVIAEVNLFVLDMNNHTHVPVLIDSAERERNRYLIIARSNQVGSNIIDGLCRVTCRQFDHNHLPMKIEGDEVTGMSLTIVVVVNNGVRLIKARVAIDNIILFIISPSQHH